MNQLLVTISVVSRTNPPCFRKERNKRGLLREKKSKSQNQHFANFRAFQLILRFIFSAFARKKRSKTRGLLREISLIDDNEYSKEVPVRSGESETLYRARNLRKNILAQQGDISGHFFSQYFSCLSAGPHGIF